MEEVTITYMTSHEQSLNPVAYLRSTTHGLPDIISARNICGLSLPKIKCLHHIPLWDLNALKSPISILLKIQAHSWEMWKGCIFPLQSFRGWMALKKDTKQCFVRSVKHFSLQMLYGLSNLSFPPILFCWLKPSMVALNNRGEGDSTISSPGAGELLLHLRLWKVATIENRYYWTQLTSVWTLE